MELPPPVNPDVNSIANQAKHSYAEGSQLLAAIQYRLGELAGTGQLDPEESKRLQSNLVGVWEYLYQGTLCAVRDESTDDNTWDQVDNTLADGRVVKTMIRIEPVETSELGWEHNQFTLGDGAVNEHPRGTICYIASLCPGQPGTLHLADCRTNANWVN
jgi:hypothetical protein